MPGVWPDLQNDLRHESPRFGRSLEVFLEINGLRHGLCRAVDQDGDVLDLVHRQRGKKAAKKFFCKPLKRLQHDGTKNESQVI